MRTFLRKVEEAIASGSQTAAAAALDVAAPLLMRAAQKGIVHKNTASRKVSRLPTRDCFQGPACPGLFASPPPQPTLPSQGKQNGNNPLRDKSVFLTMSDDPHDRSGMLPPIHTWL